MFSFEIKKFIESINVLLLVSINIAESIISKNNKLFLTKTVWIQVLGLLDPVKLKSLETEFIYIFLFYI